MGKTVFTRDEQQLTLTIERVFPAPPSRVWKFMTDSTLLDKWWAPQPWKTRTVRFDFRVGGHWLYAMVSPDGDEHFGRMDYLEIEPERRYKSSDVFCDADGVANESLPRQVMSTELVAQDSDTKVVVVIEYASLDDLNKVLEMGMEQGFTMAQDQLEALLAA